METIRLVHLVVDYAAGDLAVAEVVSALARQLPASVRWETTSVQSFDTVSTGFVVAQLACGAPKGTIVYANCAPRRDETAARSNNEGEGLVYGELASGVGIVAVNSGYSLSFIRDKLTRLAVAEVATGGSQFRSRDIFPAAVGLLVKEDFSFVGRTLVSEEAIPPVPPSVIGYVDSFGNIKTTMREGDPFLSQLTPGQRVATAINGIQRVVTVASGSFSVQEGDIAFAPGSSGHDRRFWEIFQRGGSAWATYGCPRAGAPILFENAVTTVIS